MRSSLPGWSRGLRCLWLALTTQNTPPKEPKLFLFLMLLNRTHALHLQTHHSLHMLQSCSEMSRMVLAECWSGTNQEATEGDPVMTQS